MVEWKRKKLGMKVLEKRIMLDASLGGLATTTVIAENTANAAPQIIDSDVTVTGTTTDFNGDLLSVSTTGGANDQLSIRHEGNAAGQIGFDGVNIQYSGMLIGTLSSDGVNGSNLTIDLNINASKAAIERLIENVTYQNYSDNPLTNRTLNFSLGSYFSENVSLTIVPQNDAPVINSNTGITVNEGSSGIITPAMLDVTDPDNTDAQVVFNVTTAPLKGRLELTTNAGVSITSFTLSDLNNNYVRYVHDDSETFSDSFNFTVTDGNVTSSAHSFSITINAVDDAPTIITNTGADVSLGFSISIGGDAETFGTERFRLAPGMYSSFESQIDGRSSMFTIVFTTAATNQAVGPGQVIFESGSSARGIGLYLDSSNRLVWYSGAGSTTPDLSSGSLLANSTQYAVVIEIDRTTNEIRMHYRQAGNFDWFSYGRPPEAIATGYTDTADLSGSDGSGVGRRGGSTYGGYTGTVSGSGNFSGTIDSDLVIYNMPTDTGTPNTKLIATDTDDTSASLIYTLTSNVAYGTLYREGIALGINDTFTQQDLNIGSVTYQSTIGNNDQFTFSLFDGTNTISGQTFEIRVSVSNNAPAILHETIIYQEDFEGGTSGWNRNTTSIDPILTQFWGRFNNNINVAGNQELFRTFTLSGTQEYVTINFDFYEIDSWDNEAFYVFINDVQIIADNFRSTTYDLQTDGTFGNITYNIQELTDGLGFISYVASNQDQIVSYSLTIKNTDASLKLGFGTNLNGSSFTDESFGIDNIIIKEVGTAGVNREFNLSELVANNDQVGFVTASDPDVGQSLSYSIAGGTGSGIFSIDSSTGEIKVSNSSLIDFESGTTSYTLVVRATDNGPGLLFNEQTVTVNIRNALENNAPVSVPSGSFTIAENAAVNDDVGTVTSTDPDGDTITYSIVNGNADNVFKINQNTGLIEINDRTLLDYDRAAQYTIRIRATDDAALSKYTDRNVIIYVTNVDERPTFNIQSIVESQYSGVYYNSANGNFYKLDATNRNFNAAFSYAQTQTIFGVVGHMVTITSASELSFVDQLTTTHAWIALSDAASEGSWYWMDGPEKGTQIVRNGNVDNPLYYNNWSGSEPNSGVGANYGLMNNNDYWYDDGIGNSRHSVIEWEGKDVINNSAYYVSHSLPDASDLSVGTSVGFVRGLDPEGDSLIYSIFNGNSDAIFEIDAATGEIRIADTTNLDASIRDNYTLTIRGTETIGGKYADVSITVYFNDALSLTTNSPLTVSENASAIISTANLNITDIDNVSSETIFRVQTKPAYGRLELSTYPGYEISSFTYTDVQNNRIVYIHDGSQTASDSFVFSVTDGHNTVSGATFNIVIDDVNQAPGIITNTGATVLEGGSITITNLMLNSNDPDLTDTPDQLTYTASSYQSGSIRVNGITQNTFTQADINNSRVVFVHDGSESNGRFNFSLADGGEDGVLPVTGIFNITRTPVNDSPVITTNNVINVVEGQTVTITTANLNVTDPDDSGTGITYTLSGINNGFVELSTNPGIPIISFTQQDLDTGRVVFRHDGNEANGRFTVTVRDGGEDGASSNTATVVLNKIDVNDAPSIGVNLGSSINQNSIIILKNSVLRAVDPDDSGAGITFTITGTVNGHLERTSNPNVAITSFTQSDINNSLIIFRHSGPPTTASFDFTIADGGENGAGTASGTFNLTVDNTNDAPIIATNTSPTMSEGATLVLDTTMLDSFDPDDFGTGLTWTASNLVNGILQVNGVTQNTFTQADLDAGLVTFIHNGTETITASFDIQVADGGEDGAGPDMGTFTINVTPVNDAPVLVVNDGSPHIIDFNDFSVLSFDAVQDGSNGSLSTYTVSPDGTTLTITGNAWKKINLPYTLTANTILSFEFRTDQVGEIYGIGFDDAGGFGSGQVYGYQLIGTQVWAGMDQSFRTYQIGDGWVRFDIPIGQDYTGAMTQLVFVLDNDIASPSGSAYFKNVNFYENGSEVSMNEGSSLLITNAHINSVDVDDTEPERIFTVSNIENGHIEVSGTIQTTFTQDDINNNRVRFIHDSSDTLTAGFDISLADGGEDGAVSDSGHFSIIVNAVDDAPAVATNNGLTLNEGTTKTITTSDLTTIDTDTEPRNVIFMVMSTVTNGRLERSTAPGVSITSFTLADLEAGRVRYVHNGSETVTDAFTFRLRDGTTMRSPDTFNITINPQNDAAVIMGDLSMTVIEGGSVTLTTSDLSMTDPDDGPTQVTYTVSSLINGYVQVSGVTQTTFTQQDIINGNVVFRHDGSDTTTAGFNISLADGLEDGASSDTDVMSITVTAVDDAPAPVTNNGLTLNEGATAIISTSVLTTTDSDTSASSVIFDITSVVTYGRVELSTNAGVAITSFTLADLQAGIVRYVHNGSENFSDSFDFTVRDATTTLPSDTFSITINPLNDRAVISGDLSLNVNEGASIAITTADLASIDPDDIAADVIFMASNYSNGSIQVNGVTQNTFTYQNVIDGVVVFVHDGSETITAGFDISLADGLEDGAVADTAAVTITVVPVNDAPTNIILSGNNILETRLVGTVIGSLSTIDADLPGNSFTYSILLDADAKFTIMNNNLVLNAALDYETSASHSVTVRTNDGNGGIFDRIFTIQVEDNVAPVSLSLDNNSVMENSDVGSWVANLDAVDPNTPYETLTYTLISNPGDMFMISGNQLLVKNSSIDFETATSIDLIVRISDLEGNVFDQSVSINVTNEEDFVSEGFIPPEDIPRNLEENGIFRRFLDETLSYGRSLFRENSQILRENTTEQIQNILNFDDNITMPSSFPSATYTFSDTSPHIENEETPHYTNIREALAFLSELEDIQDGASPKDSYDVTNEFVDVLTYQQQKQERLRQALSD